MANITSGTKSKRASRSSSCSFSDMPLTGPLCILFIKCVIKPAILFLILFDGMIATSPVIFLFVWKSKVSLE